MRQYSHSQIREIHSCLRGGEKTPMAPSRDAQIVGIYEDFLKNGAEEHEAKSWLDSTLKAPNMFIAFENIRAFLLHFTGQVSTRIQHTIPIGEAMPKENAMDTDQNTNISEIAAAAVEDKATKAAAKAAEKAAAKAAKAAEREAAKAAREAAKAAPREKKQIGPKPGRGALDGKLLTIEGDNWRRVGTHGFTTVEIIRANPGLSMKQIEELGGRRKDVMWDLENNPGKITLTEDPTAQVAPAEEAEE